MVNLEYDETQKNWIKAYYVLSILIIIFLVVLVFTTKNTYVKILMSSVIIFTVFSVLMLINAMTKYAKRDKTEKDKNTFFSYNIIIKAISLFSAIIVYSYCVSYGKKENTNSILGYKSLKILSYISIAQALIAILWLQVGFWD